MKIIIFAKLVPLPRWAFNMWLLQDNGKLIGYAYQCPKCEYKTLNEQQYYCPTCTIQLDEVRIGD